MAGAQPTRRGGEAARLGHRDEGLAKVPVHRQPWRYRSFLSYRLFNIEHVGHAVQPYNGDKKRRPAAPPGQRAQINSNGCARPDRLRVTGRKTMPLPASLANSLELPVLGSPLFIVSGPELVIAQCKAGIVGSFPALNARPVEKLGEWLSRIENELGEYQALHPEKKVAPYAVNQICHASNDRLMKDMETCVKHQVPIIITSLRPPIEIVEAAHSYGGVVFHDVINVKHARKAPNMASTASFWSAPAPAAMPACCRRSHCCARSSSGSRAPCCCRARSPMAGVLHRRSRLAPTWPTWAHASSRPQRPMPIRPTRPR